MIAIAEWLKEGELRRALGAINVFLAMGNKTNPANFLVFPSSLQSLCE